MDYGKREQGPYMHEVQPGAIIKDRIVHTVSVTSSFGELDWCFIYDSPERTASSLIWAGWAWETIEDAVKGVGDEN